jgi:HNH endonuclease
MTEYGFCGCGCGEKTRIAKTNCFVKGWFKGEPIKYLPLHYQRSLRGSQFEVSPIENRFHKYVNFTDECWEWDGAKSSNGYGVILFNKKYSPTHRVAWKLYCGSIPKGLFVLHRCDNRACVNPEHLFLGTQKDNIRDGIAKGRITKESGGRFASLRNVYA